SLLPRFQPRKLGQKRWVNVDDAAGKRIEHRFVQDTHETGKSNKFDTGITQHFDELVFCFRFQTGAKSSRRQKGVGNAKLSCDIKNRRIQQIGYHEARVRSEFARPDALENRPGVASFAGSENANWQPFHLTFRVCELLVLQISSINREVE